MREDIIRTRGYDSQLAGSELSLKIASYPASAKYLANRLKGKGDTVCELCCGIGISLIELAKSFHKVIGVDIDNEILADCRHNLFQAGTVNYELMAGDITHRNVLEKITADIVLYDIPYWSEHGGKVMPAQQNPNLCEIVGNIRQTVTSEIVIYAPPHLAYEAVAAEISKCEYMQVFINNKHDRNFIFLGNLVEQEGTRVINL